MVIGIYFFKFPEPLCLRRRDRFSTVFSQLPTARQVPSPPWPTTHRWYWASSSGQERRCPHRLCDHRDVGEPAGTGRAGADARYLTDQPMLELVFAIMLPAIGSAILFNIDASSGGTDVIAMILKKYTSMNIGSALMALDVAAVGLPCLQCTAPPPVCSPSWVWWPSRWWWTTSSRI